MVFVKCCKLNHLLSESFLSLNILQLQGLQYHLDILKSQGNMSNHKWKDIDVTKWTIIEQLQKSIQKDRYIEQICFTIIPIYSKCCDSWWSDKIFFNYAVHLAVYLCLNSWNIGPDICYPVQLHR
jgi:hypothetical protein